MKPLRIFYVGVNYKNKNPTPMLLQCASSQAGQRMVLAKYSLLARSKQLQDSFERVRDNRFKSTYFEESEFIYA